ncbi:MAG: RHS repeat-associated core domain-containing protein, partial [Dehalococcoidia bacterium]|nr:RHS repeat-associated core domain-containing protein [Dehalococcoidia bacterium]
HSGEVTAYTYDGLGRLLSEVESVSGMATESFYYSYDSSHNRAQMIYISPVASFVTDYAYDLNNRLIKETKTYPDTSVAVTFYSYDNNGNQVAKYYHNLQPSTGAASSIALQMGAGIDTFSYDGLNRLISVTVDGIEAEYAYKSDGLRYKTTKTDGAGSTESVVFIWDGAMVSAEIVMGLSANNVVSAKYIRGINLLASETGNGRSYFLFNAHGDVVQLTDGLGIVTKSYVYDAFGNEHDRDPNDLNPWRYCGEYYDSETGTYYLRARYYDPNIGRFISADPHWNVGNMIYGDNPVKWNEREPDEKDPLGLATYTLVPSLATIMQSGNLYAYCSNNPVMFVDPSGEIFMFVTAAVGAVAGAVVGGVVAAATGNNVWAGAAIGAAAGGLIGLGAGAAAGILLAGSATASTASVMAGASLAMVKAGTVTGTLGAAVHRTWQLAEAAVRKTYDAVTHTFYTPYGNRIVDGWNKTTKTIHEVKYGYQSLSSAIQQQIVKDSYLLQSRQVSEVVWHFHRSAQTGMGGGSQQLIEALIKAGFKIIFH